MLPCWTALPTARPSFTDILVSLEKMLGEEGQEQYELMFTNYMRRLPLIHRDGEDEGEEVVDTSKLPLPPSDSQDHGGYIQINSADCGGGGGAGSYIKMETAEGYARYSTTAGGYIALQDINK